MTPVADRLALLRKRAKLRSKSAAAKAYGIGYEVYKKIEASGVADPRNLTPEQARDIAAWHGVSPGWLLFGEGAPEGSNQVPLRGKIGAGQEMMLYENANDGETVSAEIADEDTSAFEVEGDSMIPLARNRDIIFVGPPRRDISALIGRECAVLLHDGRRFLKVIERGSKKDLFDLVSYNAETMRDVSIHSAGILLGIRRRYRG